MSKGKWDVRSRLSAERNKVSLVSVVVATIHHSMLHIWM